MRRLAMLVTFLVGCGGETRSESVPPAPSPSPAPAPPSPVDDAAPVRRATTRLDLDFADADLSPTDLASGRFVDVRPAGDGRLLLDRPGGQSTLIDLDGRTLATMETPFAIYPAAGVAIFGEVGPPSYVRLATGEIGRIPVRSIEGEAQYSTVAEPDATAIWIFARLPARSLAGRWTPGDAEVDLRNTLRFHPESFVFGDAMRGYREPYNGNTECGELLFGDDGTVSCLALGSISSHDVAHSALEYGYDDAVGRRVLREREGGATFDPDPRDECRGGALLVATLETPRRFLFECPLDAAMESGRLEKRIVFAGFDGALAQPTFVRSFVATDDTNNTTWASGVLTSGPLATLKVLRFLHRFFDVERGEVIETPPLYPLEGQGVAGLPRFFLAHDGKWQGPEIIVVDADDATLHPLGTQSMCAAGLPWMLGSHDKTFGIGCMVEPAAGHTNLSLERSFVYDLERRLRAETERYIEQVLPDGRIVASDRPGMAEANRTFTRLEILTLAPALPAER